MSRILSCYDRSIFEISDHFIKVIFPFSQSIEEGNTANGDNNGDNNDEKQILSLVAKSPYITAREMSVLTGFSTRKISRIIRNMREAGTITRMGSSRKGYWKIQ